MKELIKQLTETYGPSGHEEQIRQVIQTHLDGLADVRIDTLGNLIARKKAVSSGAGLKVMLAAHMDEIGVIVTHIDERGFLRFAPVGGVNPLTLLGSRVLFADGVIGTIGRETRDVKEGEAPKVEKMYVDVGATDGASVPVSVGDIACFWRSMADLGQRLVAKAFDDRIGCAVLIQTLRELEDIPHEVYFVFTVQEEVGLRGAVTSAYGVAPDLAVAIDITSSGDTPEAHTMAVALGHGPAIKVKDGGMLTHPGVKALLTEAARQAGVSYQMEVLERGTTDAAAMQITREGVPVGAISIPTRYAHTPSEMVDYGDVTDTVKLLKTLLSNPIRAEQLSF